MTDCQDCQERERELEIRERNRRAFSEYRYRQYLLTCGDEQPDGRNDEQRALGFILEWKRRVLIREKKRAQRKLWQQIKADRERFSSNVVEFRR